MGTTIEGAGYTNAVKGSDATVRPLFCVGRWLGPVRLEVGTGLALDQCSSQVCPRAKSGGESATAGIPLSLRADVFPLQGRHLALRAGARYTLTATSQRHFDDRYELAAYHGLAVTPIFAYTSPNPWGMGVPGGARLATLSLEIPVGIVTPLDDYRHPGVSIGGAFSVTSSF